MTAASRSREPAPARRPASYRFGPLVEAGHTAFRLWAPSAAGAELLIEGRDPVAMQRGAGGFFVAPVADAGPGTRYKFRVGGMAFPDPASRQQEGDSGGWSIVRTPIGVPPSPRPLRPWHETVIAEVHVGTATPEGSFGGLTGRLEHFRDAGYTCLEIMPLNEFAGSRGWGYDGVLVFAPEASYGTPEELRALVDRAHALGLTAVLDVVYNHFGAVDNFIGHYAPEFFEPASETPWGAAINFNEEMVRQFYYENAAMWLAEYDFDGLRFDSVHEMRTAYRSVFLGDLAKTCRAAKPDALLIIENIENSASWLDRTTVTNRPINFLAQWNDDIHHVLNFLASGEARMGYEDTSRDPVADLEKALADGFVHDGEAGQPSDGRTRGEPAGRLPPDAFITYVQNHDQIGNRADGARLPGRVSAEKLDFLHFVAFLAPQTPLFFMGEEAHLRPNFYYFIDLPPEAAEATRAGRERQLREIFAEMVPEGGLPDPNDPATFEAAKLDWAEYAEPERQASLQRFRALAGYRRELVWPLSATISLYSHSARQGDGIIVNWVFQAGTLSMALNPTDAPIALDCLVRGRAVCAGSYAAAGESLQLAPWSAVAWNSLEPAAE
ncbi:MAG: alpha-amylase family glycosyl hydrolase [Devosia sp.]